MNTKLGRVSSVHVNEDQNKVFVSVLLGTGAETRQIPFVSMKPSFWLVPQEGDIVEVAEVERERVARFPQNPASVSMPGGLGEGDVCLKLDDNTELTFKKSGSGYDVRLTASGDVTIESAGSVTIGDAEAVSVAVQEHTHEYSWADDAGSGTTSIPNEDGTETQIK